MDKPINYKRVKEIMRQVRGREKLAWKMWKEADDKNDPLFKELAVLRQRVRELESANYKLIHRNQVLEGAFGALREVEIPA